MAFAIAEMLAIFIWTRPCLMPPRAALRALTLKIVNDANDGGGHRGRRDGAMHESSTIEA